MVQMRGSGAAARREFLDQALLQPGPGVGRRVPYAVPTAVSAHARPGRVCKMHNWYEQLVLVEPEGLKKQRHWR